MTRGLPSGMDVWTAVLSPALLGIPRQGVRLARDAHLAEGTVVVLARRGEPAIIGVRGPAVVRDGTLVLISEMEALDLLDPSRAAERRYRRAVLRNGLPDQLKRHVDKPGHDWEAGCASPVDDEGLAHVYCAKVRGRHVWTRAVTYPEARELGITL